MGLGDLDDAIGIEDIWDRNETPQPIPAKAETGAQLTLFGRVEAAPTRRFDTNPVSRLNVDSRVTA